MTLHILDSFSVHHQVSSTVHRAMVYVIQVCWQLASEQSAQPLWPIPIAVCTVLDSWWWTEKLSQNMKSHIPKISLRN